MMKMILAALCAVVATGCAYRDPVRDINQAVTELDRSIWPEFPNAEPLKPKAVKPLK